MTPRDEKAYVKFAEYRALYPSEHEDRIWAAVAEYFAMKGDGPRTLLTWEKARTLNAEWGPHRLGFAKALIRAHKWMEAVHELEACAELDSSGLKPECFDENDLYFLGYALFGAKRFKEASEAWRAAGNSIRYWADAQPLKHFHMHRGWACHLEHDFLDAIDAYKRALVAPGPGDTAEDDDMDTADVDACQERMNPTIERYFALAQAGELLDSDELSAMPFCR
ncbi:MAG: hypothetical protein EXS14_07455 [Planctomycetes bacterium]|nr:hypothetical protein [Planctomycetota bacterium]